eukprot:818939-Rhodomonas_salina.3
MMWMTGTWAQTVQCLLPFVLRRCMRPQLGWGFLSRCGGVCEIVRPCCISYEKKHTDSTMRYCGKSTTIDLGPAICTVCCTTSTTPGTATLMRCISDHYDATAHFRSNQATDVAQ